MKVVRASSPGWDHYFIYHVKNYDDWCTIYTWMAENDCDGDLITSGGHGYIFQVKTNHEWFVLRWS